MAWIAEKLLEAPLHTTYSDIRSRIQEEPSWFDEFAVPRYGPFTPAAMANFYVREAVLVLAACQSCGRHFRLGMSRPYSKDDPDLVSAIRRRTLHYGDPPNIGCCSTGPMTTVVELKVLEYWRLRRKPGTGWERDASLEVAVCSMDDDPRYEAYNTDRMRNPAYPSSFGVITEEPDGAQFEELVADLLARYPATPRETAEAAVRSVWEKHAPSWRCLQLAEASLADEHQWPTVRPNENGA